MLSSIKSYGFLLFTSSVYANYYGGVGVGPFMDSNDNAICPPGTSRAGTTAWCCPTGTVFDVPQENSDILCCPTASDCLQDVLANGIQCADPSMTLFTSGVQELCCPAGYFLNDLRYCVNSGPAPAVFHSTAQSGTLTPSGGSATASGSTAMTTGASVATTTSGSKTTATGGSTSTKSSSAGAASTTSNAAAANFGMGVSGVMGSLVAIGIMALA